LPHQIIEYSANLDAHLDIAALVKAMHETAVGIDALPTGGIRTRAERRDQYRIADGHPDNAFINVTLRIARGRTLDERKGAGEALFGTLRRFVEPIYRDTPLALSFEIQEIEPETRWKQGNIRDFMTKRSQQSQ
jgi:5-carboxymethyl-2-hydroxymuconate isomerase